MVLWYPFVSGIIASSTSGFTGTCTYVPLFDVFNDDLFLESVPAFKDTWIEFSRGFGSILHGRRGI